MSGEDFDSTPIGAGLASVAESGRGNRTARRARLAHNLAVFDRAHGNNTSLCVRCAGPFPYERGLDLATHCRPCAAAVRAEFKAPLPFEAEETLSELDRLALAVRSETQRAQSSEQLDPAAGESPALPSPPMREPADALPQQAEACNGAAPGASPDPLDNPRKAGEVPLDAEVTRPLIVHVSGIDDPLTFSAAPVAIRMQLPNGTIVEAASVEDIAAFYLLVTGSKSFDPAGARA